MAPHSYIKRLEKLEQALAAQLKLPVAVHWLPFDASYTTMDYERVQEEVLDTMVAAGEIGPGQPGRGEVHPVGHG